MAAAKTRGIQGVISRLRDIAYTRPHDADWYAARALMGSSPEALLYARDQGLTLWEAAGYDPVTWLWMRRDWGRVPAIEGGAELLVLRSPVTQQMWRQTMRTNPSAHRLFQCQVCSGASPETCQACRSATWGDLPSHPVERVTWLQAVRFCNALAPLLERTPAYTICGDRAELAPGADGPRLPTEAEWAHACLAVGGALPHGELRTVQTRPVDRLPANAWGLRGMLGNVWEWCWDEHPMDDGAEMRAVRGGSFLTPTLDPLKSESLPALTAWDDVGFRPVMPLFRQPSTGGR